MIASTLPSDISGFSDTPPRASHSSAVRRVLPPGSNSSTGLVASTSGVIRAGSFMSRGAISTNSSFTTGVISKLRPDTGSVTSAMSMVLSSTARAISAVLPVVTVISSEGSAARSSFRIGGSRKMQAVAPVPRRTRPAVPVVCCATASTADATAALI
ncbi:hypothetical protein ACVII1_000897 [Bradyrhizobium elkanii]